MKKQIFKIRSLRMPGMSLIEIMLVGTLVIAAMVGVFQLYKTLKAKSQKQETENLVKIVKQGVESFMIDVGRFPQSLKELVEGPSNKDERSRWQPTGYAPEKSIVDGGILDSYGNELDYATEGAKKFKLKSWGPLGVGSDVGHIYAD